MFWGQKSQYENKTVYKLLICYNNIGRHKNVNKNVYYGLKTQCAASSMVPKHSFALKELKHKQACPTNLLRHHEFCPRKLWGLTTRTEMLTQADVVLRNLRENNHQPCDGFDIG